MYRMMYIFWGPLSHRTDDEDNGRRNLAVEHGGVYAWGENG